MIAAIPNVAYAPVVLDLVRNRWDYTDMGILDRTHIRFFTRFVGGLVRAGGLQ